ncbi:pentatricopeptide repeat-containing protein At4g01400, mitochondrial [Nymphaea colorata]|nr:pentatricopeptide repeat-containing protein At4g01400, mitochondrial [Nymphaea colorata]
MMKLRARVCLLSLVVARFPALLSSSSLDCLPNSCLSFRTSAFSFSSSASSSSSSLPSSQMGSPAHVQKLIASQDDPLLAKEIFDLASRQPGFRHSYSAFHTLIVKLGRSNHFSLMDSLLRRLKSESYPVTPGLFVDIMQIYCNAKMLDDAVKTFLRMPEFNCKPLTKHFNSLLRVLIDHNQIRMAYSLFQNSDSLGISPNIQTFNILIKAFCLNNKLSIAYSLFNQIFKRDMIPDVECYRILMQGLCRKSQVKTAFNLLDDMLNKGFVPDGLTYTSLLNSLCRKKKLREAYKLLCRMKVKGCNPDILHYNTLIVGFCREGRGQEAQKVLDQMPANGCNPNAVSYRTLINGLCKQSLLEEAKAYLDRMVSLGLDPHCSTFHSLIHGYCQGYRIEEACGIVELMLKGGFVPHIQSWEAVVPRICDEDGGVMFDEVVKMAGKDAQLVGRCRQYGFSASLSNLSQHIALRNKVQNLLFLHYGERNKETVAVYKRRGGTCKWRETGRTRHDKHSQKWSYGFTLLEGRKGSLILIIYKRYLNLAIVEH